MIGKGTPRIEAVEKLTGRAQYLDDIKLPQMLYGKVLRSPIPHGKILNINTSKAKKVPGVSAIVTGKEVPFTFGPTLKDEPFLAIDKVRYVGEPVVAVAAQSIEAAEEALDEIKVEYEELPPILDSEQAIAERNVLIHEQIGEYKVAPGIFPVRGSNICNYFKLRKGDPEKAFAAADLVREDVFTTPPVQHASIEPHGAIAQVDINGRIVIWSNTQSPYNCRRQMAEALGIPLNQVRVLVPWLGGGFGGKSYLRAEPIAVALALNSGGRPVKVIYTREEEFMTAVRHPTKIRVKSGVKRSGSLLAREVELIFDTGAYADIGPRITRNTGFSAIGPYEIPNVKIDSYCVYTNKPSACGFRGFGIPQMTWAVESHMDCLAEQLNMDPLDFRLKNCVKEGSISATGQVLRSVGLRETLEKAATAIKWRQSNDKPAVGRGIACMHKNTVTPASSSAIIKLNEDASATVYTSTVDMGQGSSTLFAQIVAHELGIPMEKVFVTHPDTDFTPYDMATASSRSTFFMGNAIKNAAADVREQLLEIASDLLEARKEDLVWEAGKIWVKGLPQRQLAVADLPLGESFYVGGVGKGKAVVGRGVYSVRDATPLDPETGQGANPSVFWMYAAQAAKVAVNQRTGTVKILVVSSAHDVGRVLNPLSAQGQIEGAIVMGLGTTLLEEMYLEQGRVINCNFLDYKIPTALDAPEMIPLIVEEPHSEGPYGAKGLGEPALAAIAAAVGNALSNAVGIRIKSLPITPEKVLTALERHQRSEGRDSKEIGGGNFQKV